MKPSRALALAAATLIGVGVAGCSTHAGSKSPGPPGATESVTVVAVDSSGNPVHGFRDTTKGQPTPDAADCTEPSPAAVSANIYHCWPAYYAADVCWQVSELELLCMDDPWAKQLHRIRSRAALAPVNPPAVAKPMALLLDDGTHCRLRSGGAWGHRYDGLQAFYGCVGSPGLVVLAPADVDPIDRSAPVWTVRVGAGETPDPSAPAPLTHRVLTAWFAGR